MCKRTCTWGLVLSREDGAGSDSRDGADRLQAPLLGKKPVV